MFYKGECKPHMLSLCQINFNHHSIMDFFVGCFNIYIHTKAVRCFFGVWWLFLVGWYFFYFQIFHMFATRYSLKQLIGLCFIFLHVLLWNSYNTSLQEIGDSEFSCMRSMKKWVALWVSRLPLYVVWRTKIWVAVSFLWFQITATQM